MIIVLPLLQVLNAQPDGGESGLYSFCADFLEQKLNDRDKTSKKARRREATFNLYATDSGETTLLLCFI